MNLIAKSAALRFSFQSLTLAPCDIYRAQFTRASQCDSIVCNCLTFICDPIAEHFEQNRFHVDVPYEVHPLRRIYLSNTLILRILLFSYLRGEWLFLTGVLIRYGKDGYHVEEFIRLNEDI